jgi:hypothetical protein
MHGLARPTSRGFTDYIEGLTKDGHPDLDLQLSTGLAVVDGILAKRLVEATEPILIMSWLTSFG